jgi:sporulation protein YlmC with PRC-barrel domain
LRCTEAELVSLPSFLETEFVPSDQAEDDFGDKYEGDAFMLWPYRFPEDDRALIDVEQVPPGELAIPRGIAVKATDGHVGHVDEFLINPETGHITHLILGEGHLWGRKEVTIPVSAIKRIEEDGVYLKLDKEGIKQLPTIPLKK